MNTAAPAGAIALATEALSRFGRVRFRATGGSMLPAIAPGDVLVFQSCTAAALRPGQVALIRRDGTWVAHRLMASHPCGRLQLQGDALAAADPLAHPDDVLGVLVAQQRGARSLHAGGRHWLRRQCMTRWLVRRSHTVYSAFGRVRALAHLVA